MLTSEISYRKIGWKTTKFVLHFRNFRLQMCHEAALSLSYRIPRQKTNPFLLKRRYCRPHSGQQGPGAPRSFSRKYDTPGSEEPGVSYACFEEMKRTGSCSGIWKGAPTFFLPLSHSSARSGEAGRKFLFNGRGSSGGCHFQLILRRRFWLPSWWRRGCRSRYMSPCICRRPEYRRCSS